MEIAMGAGRKQVIIARKYRDEFLSLLLSIALVGLLWKPTRIPRTLSIAPRDIIKLRLLS